jgi:hypothetical protein
MLHISMDALAISLKAQLNREPEVEVNMSRYWMAKSSGVMEKAYKRDELQAMTSDPSVITMTKEAMPALGKLQDVIDKVLFPTAAEDAQTVRQLISRFDGRKGLYALQLGLGFTESTRIPPYSPLAPRVLAFADGYPR